MSRRRARQNKRRALALKPVRGERFSPEVRFWRERCEAARGDMPALCRAALFLSITHDAQEFRRAGVGSPARTLGAGAGA